MKSFLVLAVAIAILITLMGGVLIFERNIFAQQGRENADQKKNEKVIEKDNSQKEKSDKINQSGDKTGKDKDDKIKGRKDKDKKDSDHDVVIFDDDDDIIDHRKANKVTVCHKADGNPVTINISENALKAHLAHGDVQGDCDLSATDGDRDIKDIILKRREARTGIFNTISQAEEAILFGEAKIRQATNGVLRANDLLTQLRNSPDANETEIEEKVAAITLVEQLINDLRRQVNQTQTVVQRNRNLLVQLDRETEL